MAVFIAQKNNLKKVKFLLDPNIQFDSVRVKLVAQ